MSNYWDKMAEVFEQARKIPRNARSAFLDEACRDTPAMRPELDLLLANYKEAPTFFEDLGQVVPTPLRETAPQSEADPYQLIGSLIADEYTVLKKLGAGGMGVVYQAFDVQLERVMALKFLSPELSGNFETRSRFFTEARAASALDHPNICTIQRVGETDQGQLFIAMRYYQGETLRTKVARGALPLAEALDYAVQITRALVQAHALGIVHRDIKPANVMVTEPVGEDGFGLVKVLDFGLAKMGNLELTKQGATLGTVGYMSPEQIRGKHVDHRTDLWALGVVLYEMLTGAHPFHAASRHEATYLAVNETPTPPAERNPDVPRELGQIVMKCLEKELEHRYASARDLLADLKTFRQAPVVLPRPPRR